MLTIEHRLRFKCLLAGLFLVRFSLIALAAQESGTTPGVKITILPKAGPMLRVFSGNLVYEEQLQQGQLRTRSWSPLGIIKPDFIMARGELPPADEPIACSFGITVDGQELWDRWQWTSVQETPCHDGHCRQVAVELTSGIRPIRVKVHTQVDGNPFLKRWLEITNTGRTTAAIGTVYPMSGFLFAGHRLNENLSKQAAGPFSLLRPVSMQWIREDDFRWMALPDGSYVYGNPGYGPPFAVVRNEVTGELFLIHFAWSGNYTFEFYNVHNPANDDAWLYFRIGLARPEPVRVLQAGETVITPAVHIGHMPDGLDAAVQALHRYLRHSVLPSLPSSQTRPIEMNAWGFVREEMTEEKLKQAVDVTAAVGAELFTVDAGWYSDVNTDWYQTAGDWKTGSRLPHGLEPVFDYARGRGLLCGLWVDLERIGLNSQLKKQHPDWVVTQHGSSDENSALDFTKPEVVKYAEDTLAGLIDRYKLDVFRLDYNTGLGRGGMQDEVDGYVENTYWRHYDAVYALYSRIRKRFPNLLMENCAGGGGRNDLGMLSNFHWTQISDESGAVRELKLLNGFSLAFPPEYGMNYVGFVTEETSRYGDIDFRLRAQMFSDFGMAGAAPDLASLAPDYLAEVKHHLRLYKTFIRPMLNSALVYHHTPILPNTEPGEWVALEYATPDHTRGYAGIFRLAGAKEDRYRFLPRGLDTSKTYKVTFDNTESSVRVSGFELERDGINVRIAGTLRSELIFFEAQ
jgi:alpha-galactosidase